MFTDGESIAIWLKFICALIGRQPLPTRSQANSKRRAKRRKKMSVYDIGVYCFSVHIVSVFSDWYSVGLCVYYNRIMPPIVYCVVYIYHCAFIFFHSIYSFSWIYIVWSVFKIYAFVSLFGTKSVVRDRYTARANETKHTKNKHGVCIWWLVLHRFFSLFHFYIEFDSISRAPYYKSFWLGWSKIVMWSMQTC